MKDADRKNHHSEYSCSQKTWIRFQPLMAYVLSQMQLSTKGNRDCWINVKRLHIGVHLIFSARPHQQLLSVMMYSSLAEPVCTSAGISAGIDMTPYCQLLFWKGGWAGHSETYGVSIPTK